MGKGNLTALTLLDIFQLPIPLILIQIDYHPGLFLEALLTIGLQVTGLMYKYMLLLMESIGIGPLSESLRSHTSLVPDGLECT